ncbi:PepSY domain-containing protein [Paenibacillus donghaensis]|uniref:PepSY domain-containing protein n=1 Tax=Paenibacillus donghaensis TaxID=414771 RepID=A0A2Z2KRV7_9BACL|nr:PepSY domain-containing protein [Paenibacillus donghaensis]ASA24242.1 hypothetical protein B9T62_27850 [Paenibacillus donghaensis]
MNMRTKMWGGAIAAAVLVTGGSVYGISTVQGAPAGTPNNQTSQQKAVIGFAKAEQLALKEAQGVVESIELEGRAGSKRYEVEIEQANRDVDVLIDAYTGKTLKVRNDDDRDHDNRSVNSTTAGQNSGAKVIGAGAASAAAAKAATGTVTEVNLDRDDGELLYEVELQDGRTSTEVGVDAFTGKVVYVDADHDDDDDDYDGDND